MARKKKAPGKPAKAKTSKKPIAKTATKKPVSDKRKPATRRKPAGAKATAKGVDSLLKSFAKERVALTDQLKTVSKKIDQLTNRIEAAKTELIGLRKQKTDTEFAIATVESRRDEEIGTLLAELGVDLNKATAAASKAARKKQVEQEPTLFEGTLSESKPDPSTPTEKPAAASAKPK